MRRAHGLGPAAAALAAVAALTGGCGADGGSSAEPSPVAIVADGPRAGRVSVDAPRSVEAGLVELSLTSSGSYRHDAQLLRIEGRHSKEEIADHLESVDGSAWPRWLHAAGGVGVTEPGETRSTTQLLEPGTYFLADTQEPPDESGAKITGGARGGVARLEVVGDREAELPPTRARIVARDHAFDAEGIRAGRSRVTFENQGDQAHEAVIFRLRSDASLEAAVDALSEIDYPTVEPSPRSPLDLRSFQTVPLTAPGTSIVTELELRRGRYLVVCYSVDRAGGSPHVGLGMTAQLSIGKRDRR